MSKHFVNPNLRFSLVVCGILLSFACTGQCRPHHELFPSNSTGLEHNPRSAASGENSTIDSSKNSTSRSWFDRSIQVKCRCDYGCADVAVDFVLNRDVVRGYCAWWITPGFDNNDKGEWCSRGYFKLGESSSYATLTPYADSNYVYRIKWKQRWYSFSHGRFSSKVIIGSGSGCKKIYKS